MPARIAAAFTLKNRPGSPLFCAYLFALLFISAVSSSAQTTAHSPGWVVLRGTPFFGPKFSLVKVDRCLQYIVDRSLLLGLWEL